jgi:hypothetical protein
VLAGRLLPDQQTVLSQEALSGVRIQEIDFILHRAGLCYKERAPADAEGKASSESRFSPTRQRCKSAHERQFSAERCIGDASRIPGLLAERKKRVNGHQ